ncbi:putative nucleic acid-binding protein [Natronocella acetinitrilica]|uniref:Ribonuclease VapC n=1 Tax=Natronocella acetinitrilica TaxID=414046 RepID=A0AAE3G515_9GAMM|nr:type II toxin-antitoxin system VapC family toxin [Natronocella acetinitrilica]MCP1673977.1 putative nucleic acid-binding protein [Natronocella acetinitrilica]
MKALLDTNILIDYLNGVEAARTEIRRYTQPVISPVSWMEVMVGVSVDDESTVRQFLAGFQQVVIDHAVAEQAVAIRKQYRVRLPDAIIWASARRENALLVTRNSKDFPADEPGVRVPYLL